MDKKETVKDVIRGLEIFASHLKDEDDSKLLTITGTYIQDYVDRLRGAIDNQDLPYLEETETTIVRKYNPDYGMDRVCNCGHPYYRHFDSYESNDPVGCKYCDCYTFEEAVDISKQ